MTNKPIDKTTENMSSWSNERVFAFAKTFLKSMPKSKVPHDPTTPDPQYIQQVDLPKDWIAQLSKAKVDHDKCGGVSSILVLPLTWVVSFAKKVASDDDEIKKYDKSTNDLWGAKITFGPVDKPVAAGDWRC